MSTETHNKLIAELMPVAAAFVQVEPVDTTRIAEFLIAYLDERLNTESLDDPFAEIAETVTDEIIAVVVVTVIEAVLRGLEHAADTLRDLALKWMSERPIRQERRKAAREARQEARKARAAARSAKPATKHRRSRKGKPGAATDA